MGPGKCSFSKHHDNRLTGTTARGHLIKKLGLATSGSHNELMTDHLLNEENGGTPIELSVVISKASRLC